MLVLKFGGGDGINRDALACDAAALAKDGEKIVIVVGANAELTRAQKKCGIESRMITSENGEKSRWTDEETLNLLRKVYGDVANDIAVKIRKNSGMAEAWLASENSFVVAQRHKKMRIVENNKRKVIDGDLTGRIEKVNIEKMQEILASGKIVVITPPAITTTGEEVNVDGDKIASKIAIALGAEKLIFFSNTPGLLAKVEDEASLIHDIPVAKADFFAVGRMKKKILAAARAIASGVGEVIFADGRVEKSPIRKALVGKGTRVF